MYMCFNTNVPFMAKKAKLSEMFIYPIKHLN